MRYLIFVIVLFLTGCVGYVPRYSHPIIVQPYYQYDPGLNYNLGYPPRPYGYGGYFQHRWRRW